MKIDEVINITDLCQFTKELAERVEIQQKEIKELKQLIEHCFEEGVIGE